MVFPWFVLFCSIVAGIVLPVVKYSRLPVVPKQLDLVVLGIGAFLCVLLNFRSLSGVGLWMSESLPESLRYGGSMRWFFRGFKAAAIAAIIWFIGQLPWIPLIWQAAVIPTVFMVSLFTIVFSFIGPILKWSSNLAWRRAFGIFFSLPVLLPVPLTAVFLGQNVVKAYRESHAEVIIPVKVQSETPADGATVARKANPAKDSDENDDVEIDEKALHQKIRSGRSEARADVLRKIHSSKETCVAFSKDVLASLEPTASRSILLWALRDVECADLKSAFTLPRLVQIMTENHDPDIRAAAIMAMKKFGAANIRLVAYLLVKRINEKEPGEVVNAAATLMAQLGGEDAHRAGKRLEGLLDTPGASQGAAQALTQIYHREGAVKDYIAQHLPGSDAGQKRAIDMICFLPEEKRDVAQPYISKILSTIEKGDGAEPGVKAIGCLGRDGYDAVRAELKTPQVLKRPVAARVFSQMNLRSEPDAVAVADDCVHDEDVQVRKYCSQTLGQLGAPALPKILDLLESNTARLREAGQDALNVFNDPKAKSDLKRVLVSNSGWMANNRKLQLAQKVGLALAKIEEQESAVR